MSNRFRTPEEYIELYAEEYCGGNVGVAKTHAIVKESVKALAEEKDD